MDQQRGKTMKVALYARVSTDEQDASLQIHHLREWANRMNHKVIREYVDQAVSGTKSSRPAFDEMMNDMRLFKFEAIAVVKLDRLGRSLKHLLSLFDEFNAKGVSVICTTQPIDTSSSNPLSKVILALLGAFAELERDMIAERTKAGMQARRARLEKEGKIWKLRGKDRKPRQLRGGQRVRKVYPRKLVLPEPPLIDTPQSEVKQEVENDKDTQSAN
jgi:DNA invertase Pin-like site-specific DNA recombinase